MEFDKYKINIEQSIETREALKKLEQQKIKATIINVLVTIAGVIAFIFLFKAYLKNHNIAHLILCFCCFGIISSTYTCTKDYMIKPFQTLLDTAKANDRIRHEEKIRFYERKRLEESEFQTENINLKSQFQEEQEIQEKVQKELEQYKKLKK